MKFERKKMNFKRKLFDQSTYPSVGQVWCKTCKIFVNCASLPQMAVYWSFSHVSGSETCSYYGKLANEILPPFHCQNTSVAFYKQLLEVSLVLNKPLRPTYLTLQLLFYSGIKLMGLPVILSFVSHDQMDQVLNIS